MTTQAYHSGGEFEQLYRPTHRVPDQYYDRNAPYHHYPHHRRSHRSEYPGRHTTRTLIHEPEAAAQNGQAQRKRIGVACSRCRKRKIKCSGDVGDGSGCTACKAQGGDSAPCTFNRVGSDTLLLQYEDYPVGSQSASSQDITYSLDAPATTMYGTSPYQGISHRPSLPTLQTRSSYPDSFDSYSDSPVDGYPYSSYSAPRNDSMGTSYEPNYRSWSNATMLPPTQAFSAYDQSPGYTFGSISAPSFPSQMQQLQQNNRLPSVTSDTFSSLNMGNMYTALPTQTVQSRRLPIPQTAPSYEPTPYSGPELPEIRPLAEPRSRLNTTHSRVGAAWPSDMGYSSVRNGLMTNVASSSGIALQPMQSTAMSQEQMSSYQYSGNSIATTGVSPSASPAVGPSASASYGNGSSYAMTPVSYGSHYGLPPITTVYNPGSSSSRAMNAPPATSYSFSDETTTTAPSSERGGSDATSSAAVPSTYSSYTPIRHPQPQHAASVEALRRQASFEQQHQRQRGPGVQRISVSDLSGGGPPYSAS